MAIDIALRQNEFNEFDVSFENGDFKLVDSFDTSLTLSLFADARALPSQVPRSELRRGWWGNQFDDDFPLYELGSRLWLLNQSRKTQSTLNNAVDFTRNALQWLVDKNHAVSVDVQGEFTQNGIRLKITINRGNSTVETRYFDLWNNSGQI
jgi:phage gp46-like protein